MLEGVVWLEAGPEATAQDAGDRVVARILTWTLWGAALTQTVALPGNIELSMVFALVAVLLLGVNNRAVVRPWRVATFGVVIALIAASSILGPGGAMSIEALGMVAVLYGIFVVAAPVSMATYCLVARGFQSLAIFIAVMVGYQWVSQLAGLPTFHLFRVLPEEMIYKSYNYLQPLRWGLSVIKPNGIFMLEASHCSQLLAIGIVVEIVLFRRLWVIGLLGLALVSTFAGTGILMLLITAPFLLPYIPRRLLHWGLLLGVVAGAGLWMGGMLDYFLGRIGEFGMVGTSGYGRFVEPYLYAVRNAFSSADVLLFGAGLGNGTTFGGFEKTKVPTPMTKSIVEVGVAAALAWLLYFHVAMLRSIAPFPIVLVVLLQYDLMNGSLLVPIHVVYCYLLCGAMVRGLPLARRVSAPLPLAAPTAPGPMGGFAS